MILGHLAVPQELLLIPLSIPPEAAVEPAHPKLFQSSTLLPDSPSLDVKWIVAGCQIPDQFCSRTHPIPCSGSFLPSRFLDWPGHSLPFAPLRNYPLVFSSSILLAKLEKLTVVAVVAEELR